MHVRTGRGRGWARALGLGLAMVGAIAAGHARAATPPGDEPRLADYFGFLPVEVYKLDPRINGLLLRDVDGDKIHDVIVVNNGRSRIELLLSTR